MTAEILHGDCLDVMRGMDANSVDAIITDPPYGLSFMGRNWDHGVPGAAFWSEVLRVAKPGAYMLAFGGTRTYHRLTCAIEDAGFEIRDCVMWVYGCLSDDTELLTSNGWVHYDRITTDSLALAYNPTSDSFGWEQVQEVVIYDYSDTAYRIQSDHTDQIVSRNHRCLVKRGGGYAFQLAEALQREASIPVLENLQGLLQCLPVPHEGASNQKQNLLGGMRTGDNKGTAKAKVSERSSGYSSNSMCCVRRPRMEGESMAQEGSEADVLQTMQRCASRGRMGQACAQGACRLDRTISRILPREDERREQPGVAWRGHATQFARQSSRREVRPLPCGVHTDGSQRRVCDGTPTAGGESYRALSPANGSCPSQEPRTAGQSTLQSDALCQQQRPQTIRGARFTRTDLARVTPFHYVGTVWCIRIPSGAFVARRNGKVFVTGNSGFPKGKGCLKPAWEPIILARKPGKSVLPLQIDACRVGCDSRPAREVHPLRPDVSYSGNSLAGRVDQSLQSSKAVGVTSLGRWPANLIHDGSDEVMEAFAVAGERPTSKPGTMDYGRSHRLAMNAADDGSLSKTRECPAYGDTGTAARFYYAAKASRADREEGNTHPTVKPTALMQYLCRLITPPGGLVLDPFCGSGSTGKAAVLEGLQFVGIEREAEYVAIARQRIAAAQADMPLFAEAEGTR